MSSRAAFAFGSSLLLVLVACGGSTASTGSDGGTSGGTSGSSGSSGSSGTSGTSGGGACTTAVLPGDRACVPSTAHAGVAVEIGVDATDGCLGCFTTFDPCQVDVTGTDITVTMMTRTCPPPGDQACPAICALPRTTCKIPPLAAGTYTVAVTGEGARTGLPPRQLVVTADAAASSCSLPMPGMPPTPLDGTVYSTSCSVDADCVVATVGDLCQPCKCPNAAIATSASDRYAGDYRAHASQCHTDKTGIQCAACAPSKAVCTIQPNALTGTCELKPGT
jgi:hypothetical protein